MNVVGVMDCSVDFYRAEDQLCLIEQRPSASHRLHCTKIKTCDTTLVLWSLRNS